MRRLLALSAALAAASLVLGACDASPYAATVDGHDVSVAYLDNQLKQWSANRAWVTSFDSANSSASGGSGTTVAGSGGPGTYSSTFVADILDTIVQFDIVNSDLAAHGRLPSGDEMVASRAVNEYLRSGYWSQFSPSLRRFLVRQLADEAQLTPASSNQASIRSAFSQVRPYVFSKLCFDQAAARSRSAALAIAAGGNVGGAIICLDQVAFEGEPSAFQSALVALAPGQVSKPIPVPYGYDVVKLVSRASPGLSAGVGLVLSAATATAEPPALASLIRGAHVAVNPEYGTWSNGQITPPHPLARP